jgi:hypothetical protein
MLAYSTLKAGGLLASAVILAAGCDRAKGSPETAAAPAAAAPAAAAAPRVVTVVARDFAFDAPDSLAAGLVTFQLQNRGQNLHHMAVMKLDSAKTLQDLFAAFQAGGPPPAWAHDMGGPNAPDPGSDANATMALEPGNYALLCFVDIPDHVPHMMKGMSRMLHVTPAASGAPAAQVTGDVTMTLSDYTFTLSQPITAGAHTIRVQNGATQSHEVELVRLAPGKTVDDMKAWMQTLQGPPPASAIGGIAGIAPGQTQSFRYDFAAGNYVLICFLPAREDGKPHFMHGMLMPVTVS